MQFEPETLIPQKMSALDPNVLNHLRSEKRIANCHIHIMSSMITRSKLNLISTHRRNALVNPPKILINQKNDNNFN